MRKCRSQLGESRSVLTHACSAHVADCLAKDIDNSDVKSEIVEIVKYFRRHHVPNALYKQKGGKNFNFPFVFNGTVYMIACSAMLIIGLFLSMLLNHIGRRLILIYVRKY